MIFPRGYHQIHPDVSMNFQMNRWYGWVGEPDMLEEMRLVAPRIRNYPDWKREFLALAEHASREGKVLRGAYYYRAAEFFMMADDPDRKFAREKFLDGVRAAHGLTTIRRHAIPYVDGCVNGFLPAYRFTPDKHRGTIVFFGGFDSYIEELMPFFAGLRDAGHEIVAFEGPGQGGALHEAKLPMGPDWHKPVAAVLDYFGLDAVTLCGLSLGGCLAMRAAAFEARVDRVIAYDVLADFFDVNLGQLTLLKRLFLKLLLGLRAAPLVNALVKRVAANSPVVDWGIHQGMNVTGTATPFEYLQKLRRFHTRSVSARIKQDVLLMAGSEDHFVPLRQFHRQIEALASARSITARLFTRSESAQNHCQVGNYGLALATIVNWLDGLQARERVVGGPGRETAQASN